MKKALLFLVLLAVSVGLFAQDAPTSTFSITGNVGMRFIPLQFAKKEYQPNPEPGGSVGSDSLKDLSTYNFIGMAFGRDNANGAAPEVQLNMTGAYGTLVGIQAQMRFYPGRTTTASDTSGNTIRIPDIFGIGDNVKFWWRPMPELLIEAGKTVQNPFRGQIGDFWGAHYTVGSFGNDSIFSNLRTAGWQGGNAPTSGDWGILALYTNGDIRAGLVLPKMPALSQNRRDGDIPSRGDRWGATNGAISSVGGIPQLWMGNDLLYVLMRTQIAVGYTIQGIGFARLQWVGPDGTHPGAFQFDQYGAITSYNGTTYAMGNFKSPVIEAAFQLTMVQGLVLDVGGKIPLPLKPGNVVMYNDGSAWNARFYTEAWSESKQAWEQIVGWRGFNDKDENWKIQSPYQIAIGANYTGIPNLSIAGRIDTLVGGKVEVIKTSRARPAAGGFYMAEGESISLPFYLNANIWPTYTFTDLGNLKATLQIGFAYVGAAKWDSGDVFGAKNVTDTTTAAGRASDGKNGGTLFGLGAFIEKPVGPVNLQAGIAFNSGAKINNIQEDMTITIPIHFGATF